MKTRKHTAISRAKKAAWMRQWRKTHPMNAEERRKDNVRSYAGVYKRRGKLIPQPCRCGSTKVEMHHPDYSKPLMVEWLCRPCHREIHLLSTDPLHPKDWNRAPAQTEATT